MFKLILGKLSEMVLSNVGESFLSKMAEQMAGNALNNAKNIKEFKLIIRTLQKNLKSLSAKASDIEEEIKNAELSGHKKRKREVEEWLAGVKSFEEEVNELGSQVESQGLIMRLMDGGNAAKLNGEIDKLVEQSRNFGQLVLDVCGTSGETFLTNGMVGQAFNENLETILKLLDENKVSSIGVYGMGGVGKTTLAKQINNRLMQRSEGSVFWVTVSQEFTVTSLQDKIARLLGVDLSDEDEVGKRAMRLHRALSEKKNSVLILDDVWEDIDMKKVGCLFSVAGCRLLITTRSLEVCRRIGCQEEIPVEILQKGESWKLFKETLGLQIELDPEVEGIAKSMAKLCGGLPLGIIAVAGSMRGKRGTHRWRNAFLELQERVKGHDGTGEDEVFEVLRFSFDQLKKRNDKSNEFNMQQLCFLYCSLYPEDHELVRRILVGQFISDGLLSERKSRRSRVYQGHSVLDELVDVCLLESCEDNTLKMHDLVRSMALRICEGEYMIRTGGERSLKEILNEEEWTKDLEKVSLYECVNLTFIWEGISPDCPKLSTLLLWNNYWLSAISESFFSKMQGLCTLELCWNFGITKLPESISDLTSLKSLILTDCTKLVYVPYLGKLKKLRELNLSKTAIKESPRGLEELLNLEFLSLMGADNLTILPSGLLLKLVHLQHLSIPSHIKAPTAEIQNLQLLEEFHGRVNCVGDYECLLRSWEDRREHDIRYTIIVGEEEHVEAGLRIFESSCYGKRLGLFGCKVEDWRVLERDTECITIRDCEGLRISFLNCFSGLKELHIKRCGGIEWILRSDYHISNTLDLIYVVGLDDLKEVVVMERGKMPVGPSTTAPRQPAVFSSIRRLYVSHCDKMMKVGLAAFGLPNLEDLDIASCGEIEDIFKEDEGRPAATILPKLKLLRLTHLPKLRKLLLPVWGVPNIQLIYIDSCGDIEEIFEDDEGSSAASILTTLTLPKLTEFTLLNLPRLKRVSKATIISNSIQEIWISKCPRLMNKLPLRFDDPAPPPSLEYIRIEREWWESLDWDIHPNLPQLLHPFLHLN